MIVNLTIDEAYALKQLVELCEEIGLLVESDDDESDYLITTGDYVDYAIFDKEDWAACLSAKDKLF